MDTPRQNHGFTQKIFLLTLLLVISPARAEEDENIASLIKPDSSANVGLGHVSGNSEERAFFGQYNGMRHQDNYLLLDVDSVTRDDASGTWTTLQGRHLGQSDRDLRFSRQKQGDWRYYADYSQLSRYYPRTVNTGLQGAGSANPSVTLLSAAGAGSELDLKIKRESIGLGLDKWLTPRLQFEVSAKNEDREGARLFGKGFACSAAWVADGVCTASTTQWALLMLPEPIKSTTRQIEAKLNFASDNLLLSGGYYGSFYTNAFGSLRPNVPGTLTNPLGTPTALDAGLRNTLALPMALPPDNEAHQFYLSGNYAVSQKTRATFKYAFTRATQNDNFLGNGLTGAPSGKSDLGGKVDTQLLQLGVTTKATQKLSLLGNLRYEDRKDKTPQALYSVEGTDFFANSKYSLKKIAGKLEGSYQLPDNYRATLGADYEYMDRGDFSSPGCAAIDSTTGDCIGSSIAGLSGVRAKTEEIGWRAELRHSLSETLNGAFSYSGSRRDGASSWLKPNSLPATGTTELSDTQIYSRTAIFPMIFMNRIRDKAKLSADWSASERLTLQFVVEDAKDNYGAPTTKGLRDSSSLLYSVDAVWIFSDSWKLTTYWSQGDQELHVAHSTGYDMVLRNLTTSLGIGLAGKASNRLELGADLSYLNDSTQYNQELDGAASANNRAFFNQQGGLPQVSYNEFRLMLYGKYALEKNADVRVTLAHQRARLDEWTWGYNDVPFTYSDNTTVSFDTRQHVTFIGASYIYKWQ